MRLAFTKVNGWAMEEEIWKDIKGFSGYEVSNWGRVRNKKTQAFMSPVLNNNGYMVIQLRRNYKPHLRLVHRLVAQAFCERLMVNHIDGNRRNNMAHNLEWVTPYGNAVHAAQMDRMSTIPARQSKRCKLKIEQIIEARQMWLQGRSHKEIGEHFSVSGSTISRALSKA